MVQDRLCKMIERTMNLIHSEVRLETLIIIAFNRINSEKNKVISYELVYTGFILVLVVKKALSLYKHSRIRSWNHPVLSNQCKVFRSRKQRPVPDRV